MTERPELTRRSLLRAGALGGSAFVAGCVTGDGDISSPTGTGTASPQADSVFQEVAVDGKNLVVRLAADHGVTGLNLIGPDGSSFAEVDVATGETTTRIQLLSIDPMLAGYDHYEPGTYELVAVEDDGSTSHEVSLEPELQITDVQQYRDGERPDDYGKLAVTVENSGTGPTWIYDVTYRDAPNDTANDSLTSDPGIPKVSQPEDPDELLVIPGQRRTFVSSVVPFLFDSDAESTCGSSTSLSIRIGVAAGGQLEKEFDAEIDGKSQAVGPVGEYTCSNISVSPVNQ